MIYTVSAGTLNPTHSLTHSHRFRYTDTYSLKLITENCGQTAADGDMVTIDSP